MLKMFLIFVCYIPLEALAVTEGRPTVSSVSLEADQRRAFSESSEQRVMPDERWLLGHSSGDGRGDADLVPWIPELSRPVGNRHGSKHFRPRF